MFRKQFLKLVKPILLQSKQVKGEKVNAFQAYKLSFFSLNNQTSYGIFNLFSKKPKVSLEQQFRNDISQTINAITNETNKEEKENLMFDVFQIIAEARSKEQSQDEDLFTKVKDVVYSIEQVVEENTDWEESKLYQYKFLLIQVFHHYNDQEKIEKYIREFSSDYFINEVFEQFSIEQQIVFTIYFGQQLLLRKQYDPAIKILEKYLNDFVREDAISAQGIQKVHMILIQIYKSLNMHKKSFENIERIITLLNQDKYGNDLQNLLPEQLRTPINEIMYLIEYCYEYQQYEQAYNLGDGILTHFDSNSQEVFDKLTYEVTLLKNLNKHYKILLSLNLEISNTQNEINQEIEQKFIKSLEKFLKYQEQYNSNKNSLLSQEVPNAETQNNANEEQQKEKQQVQQKQQQNEQSEKISNFFAFQHKPTRIRSIYAKPLIEKNLYKFSSEGKHQILKIAYKYDCLLN